MDLKTTADLDFLSGRPAPMRRPTMNTTIPIGIDDGRAEGQTMMDPTAPNAPELRNPYFLEFTLVEQFGIEKLRMKYPNNDSDMQMRARIYYYLGNLHPLAGDIGNYNDRLEIYLRNINAMTMAENMRPVTKGELDAYYRGYYWKVKKALEEWHESGRDRLFHGSTAVMLIGSKPGASCPAEDSLLATQNILLAAHSMGLGSCLIGYAVAAMKKDPSIQKSIGIPAEEEIHAVIALGYSDEVYQRVAGRKKVTPRYFEG